MKMGITAGPEITRWNSPDSTYEAELSGDHIYIYKTETNNRTMIVNQRVTGAWVEGEWSRDSTIFTYKTESQGVISFHIIEPNKVIVEGTSAKPSK